MRAAATGRSRCTRERSTFTRGNSDNREALHNVSGAHVCSQSHFDRLVSRFRLWAVRQGTVGIQEAADFSLSSSANIDGVGKRML